MNRTQTLSLFAAAEHPCSLCNTTHAGGGPCPPPAPTAAPDPRDESTCRNCGCPVIIGPLCRKCSERPKCQHPGCTATIEDSRSKLCPVHEATASATPKKRGPYKRRHTHAAARGSKRGY